MKIWLNRIKTFLNSTEEWHAFVEGFCDGFFPFIKGEASKELEKAIASEHHYYRPGVILGVIAVIWFWIGIYKVIV